MGLKDFSIIILALLLIGGIWYVAVHGGKIKNWANKANQTSPTSATPNLAADYFSEQIQIFSPQPDEIIKGTIFKITGRTKIEDSAIIIQLNDKENKFIGEEQINLSVSDEQNWKSFSQEFNAEPYEGILKIEVLTGSTQEKLARWSIRIIKSI